jgi:hypothetical protein
MPSTFPPQSFRLSNVVRAFLAEHDLEDEVTVDGHTSQVSTYVSIHEQPFKLYIEVDERQQLLSVFIYSPIRVPLCRLPETVQFLNKANTAAAMGRFAIDDDGEANPVQWMCTYDLEGGTITPRQIELMVGYGTHAFRSCWRGIVSVAILDASADEAHEDTCDVQPAVALPDNVLRLKPIDRIP